MVKHEIKKITHYEYWPFWIFYIPMIPFYLWFSIKARSLLYFTATNPGLNHGGLFNYSKFKLQEQIPEEYRPAHQFLKAANRQDFIPQFEFPFIGKPDFGERGVNVDLIQHNKQLGAYLRNNPKDIIFQEFINLPFEFGIFYVKYPNQENGKIISITGKKFLIFEGDGQKSLREFIESDSRAYFNKSYLYMKFHDQQELVLPKGEKIILEEIGNHNRGTYFYDASEINSTTLENVVTKIASSIDGFYFGRLDIKTQSVEELSKGNFKILEINGSNSEASHVYDEKYSLLQAYKEVYRHLKIQNEIGIENMKNGFQPDKLTDFVPHLLRFLFK
jgi:hypothetical protein